MKKRQLTQILGGAAIAVLALSACGGMTGQTPTEDQPTQEQTQPAEENVDQEALLRIQDQLSASLGTSFVQGWIQDGKMHIATTDQATTQEIESAGAVPVVVDFNAQQLREGIVQIMNWQAQQPDPIRTAIHGYELNGMEGGLTLRVDPGHIEELKQLLDEAKPAGEIPLNFAPSSGISTPAAG